MAKNVAIMKKKRSMLLKQQTQLRAKQKKLRADEDALMAQLEAVEDEIPADLEEQIQAVTDAQTEAADQLAELVDQLSALDEELAAVDETLEEMASDEEERGAHKPASRIRVNASFRSRSGCFDSRSQRDAFFASSEVKEFLQRFRAMLGSRRSVKGGELGIPTVMLDLIRDNLNKYSKLLPKVRLRPVSGRARQLVIGKIPEGVWIEMSGCLNELEFSLSEIELDGYAVGGFVPVPNYVLQDNDIALGEELMYGIGQSIGLALDKGIAFGKGPNSHMPVGFITRLAQTSQPGYWGENQGTWTDLHSTNIMQLNLASLDGTAFFRPLLSALAKAKPTYSADGKFWIMNDATRQDVLIRSLAYNANAALVSGMENTMPVIGGEIITLEFLPDNFIAGGYGLEYLLVEREGAKVEYSDQVMWKCNHTVFKGYARYDGQPIAGEAFVAVTYDNTAVTTTMDFAADYANTSPNSLVVTSAAGSASGTTVLTVAGAVSGTNKLAAFVGAPAPISKGDMPGTDWLAITSGTTDVTAATGSGATVVELDANGRVISIGYCASVTAKA